MIPSETNFLQKDALIRLEWPKLTEFLGKNAIFAHTQEQLKALESFLPPQERDFFLQATTECLAFQNASLGLNLENIDATLFAGPLKRHALISALGLLQIFLILRMSESIKDIFSAPLIRTKYPLLALLSDSLVPLPALKTKLEKSIDAQGKILSTASPALFSARQKQENARQNIIRELEELLRKQHIRDALQDPLWMLREDRYCLPVRTDRKNDVPGITRGISQSGSTLFIEPLALAHFQNALESAQVDVALEEQAVLKELSSTCALVQEEIFVTLEALTKFDEIQARTLFAKNIAGSAPEKSFPSAARFSLTKARHPLFLLENKPCVANNFELCASAAGENPPHILVLSGPNAGGKTIAMKTVGISLLMYQAGLFLPGESCFFSEFDKLFVEIGDRQNREEDLSTFSGHLTHIKKILSLADERSLILLDEGFVGTDPAMGVALAKATLAYLAQKKATVIITTHFSQLKLLAENSKTFFNASMEFEPTKLIPTYTLLNGIPGQSYALELATRIGLPQEILQNASSHYGDDAQNMELLLKSLQIKNREAKEEIERQRLLRKELEEELLRFQSEREELLSLRNDLVSSYREKLEKRLRAFEHRLEIRERQFEKINNISFEEKPEKKLNKQKTLSSFESLAEITINEKKIEEEKPNILYRTPKSLDTKDMLLEARLNIVTLEKSFDGFESSLRKEVESVLKLEQENKEKITKGVKPLTGHYPETFWQPQMKIRCPKFKETGTVLKGVDAKGYVECSFGLIKAKILHADLVPANESFQAEKKKQQTFSPKRTSQAKQANTRNPDIPSVLPLPSNSIDLRGFTVDIALERLELGIDKLFRAGEHAGIIIHGHGQGKIKEAVRSYLETAPYPLSYRGGFHGEGGDGVTVVAFQS